MPKGINYGKLMHKAFRLVIVDVLTQVARDGLPGEHHFFITFDTRHPGVDMSKSLRERYPEEMMIVMQEWFEDLAVMKDRFSVTLSFGGIAQSVVVPFEAIKTFVDPSVEFGLRFDGRDEAEGTTVEDGKPASKTEARSPAAVKPATEGEVIKIDFRSKH